MKRELAAAAVALLLAWPIQESIDRNRPPRPSSLLYTPDRRLMKVVASGHGPTLADLVSLQSTIYVMREFAQGKTHIEHLYALYDVVTELDPQFVEAYVTGAIFLSSLAQEPDLSIELLEKGQGRLVDLGDRVVEDPAHPGRVHPDHAERWRLLQEAAATHFVSYAGLATTPEERQEALRLGGRVLLHGAARYPRDRHPSRPAFWEEVGARLAQRRLDPRGERGWREAVEWIWTQRALGAPPDSPMRRVAERRLRELKSRANVELLERAVEHYRREGMIRYGFDHPPPNVEVLQVPFGDLPPVVDPLGVGYFMVEGRVVAPALDAELVERDRTRRIHAFHRAQGRFPASLDELARSLEGTKVQLVPVPAWVRLHYEPGTGEVRARGAPPELAAPSGQR